MRRNAFGLLFICFLLLFVSNIRVFSDSEPQGVGEASEILNASIKDTWDFGRVKETDVLKHTFTLKNESLTTMNIKGVTTSCGCTVSEVKKKRLSPQESTEIMVQFNPKGYSGKVKQYVFIQTDSSEKPVVIFVIKAEIIN